MKQTIKIITALLVALTMSSGGTWAQTFSGGSGTSTDPYQIKTIDDMTALATAVNGGTSYSSTYFRLENDLKYTGEANNYTPIGKEGDTFQGHFDGNGKTIKGIRYTYTEDATAYIGLFGYTSNNAEVKNLTLDDCLFKKTGMSSGDIAVVVGYASYTEIDNVKVKSSKAIAKKGYAAGITAYAYRPVTNCFVENTEISVFDGTTLEGLAGGIVAYENGGSASNNVVANCTIQANHVGGICGDAVTGGPIDNNHVENCTITGKESAAGISTVAGYYSGYTHGCNHSGNTVAGTTTITVPDGGAAGALFAQYTNYTWATNFYAEEVKVIIGSTTYDGTTARGYYFVGSPSTAPSSPDDYGEDNGAKGGTFYQVKLVASPATFGTVSANRQWCLSGKSMTSTVTAKPNLGSYFMKWSTTDVTLADESAATTTFTQTMTADVTITASFGKGLELTHTFGTTAEVTFWDGGTETAAPTVADLAACTDANKTNRLDNSDGKDHWVIAHIVPTYDPVDNIYWTDEKLLYGMEAAGSLARRRTSGPAVDLRRMLTLLKTDTYTDGSNTLDRHDGAGWYYYKLPKEHNAAAGYYYSMVDGFMVKQFDLSNDVITKSGNVFTVTGAGDWTADFTYDQLSYKFDVKSHQPTLKSVVIKKDGTSLLELTDAADIKKQVKVPEAQLTINPQHSLNLGCVSFMYSWFRGSASTTTACFEITVPFKGSGTESDPWQIETAADLNMLSKCSSIGCWGFDGEYLKQMAAIDMNGITDFQPIGLGLDEGRFFRGNYNGDGKTISNLKYVHKEPAYYINFGYVGLFGCVDGVKGVVQNVTLKDCQFSTEFNASAMGGIAGYVKDGKLLNNRVIGTSSISNTIDNDGLVGAIVGLKDGTATLTNNLYDYGVTVTRKNASGTTETAEAYTKRGITTEVTTPTAHVELTDLATNSGAMMYVKTATISSTASANGSTVAFTDVTPGTDCYAVDGANYYYAPGQNVPLTVTLKQRTETDDIRTFSDELTSLTMNDGKTDTDIKDALSFTMPDAAATVSAMFAESKWFTIPSNKKAWMSFYHEWTDGSAATAATPANYTVTDGSATANDTPKTIEVKTITGVNVLKAEVTTADLGGISFNGVPTLFHCEGGLPALLRFDPVADKTNSVTPYEYFKGTAKDKDMSTYTALYVMNGIGDFYFADDKSTPLAAHRCYVDLGSAAIVLPARLKIVDGEGTGISDNKREPITNNNWYSLDGRKLDGRPTRGGVYINNGKKVVIK